MEDYKREKNWCVCYATIIIFILPASIVISPSLTAFFEVILYTLFIGSSELRRRFILSLKQPIVILGGAFFLFIAASSLWSSAPIESILEHLKSWRKILLLPIAISLITNENLKDRFLIYFVASMTVCAIISWIFFIGDFTYNYRGAEALLRNHATQGISFFVAAFTSIFLIFHKKNTKHTFKILLTLSFFIIFTNSFIISTSRSSYIIGMVLIICFGFYANKKTASILIPILLITSISILYFSPTPYKQINKIWQEIQNTENAKDITSGGARVVFLKNTIPIIIESPIIGHGLKSMPIEYAKQVKDTLGWQSVITSDPHNQYILILAEQGIIGLLLFFGFIIACFYQKAEPFYKYIGLSVLLGWMTTSLFNGHFSASVEGKFIFLWCGAMLSAQLPRHKAEKKIAT